MTGRQLPAAPVVLIWSSPASSPASIAARIRSSSFGQRWEYVSSVPLAFLCPRKCCTAVTEHPAEISIEAQ